MLIYKEPFSLLNILHEPIVLTQNMFDFLKFDLTKSFDQVEVLLGDLFLENTDYGSLDFAAIPNEIFSRTNFRVDKKIQIKFQVSKLRIEIRIRL